MDCPECGAETSVVETAPYPDRVRRRRECEGCGQRFTTKETSLLDTFRVDKAQAEIGQAIESLTKSRPLVDSLGLGDAPEDLDAALLKIRKVRKRLEDRAREAPDAR